MQINLKLNYEKSVKMWDSLLQCQGKSLVYKQGYVNRGVGLAYITLTLEGEIMQTHPFEAVKKEYRLAESEARELKQELRTLRAEFAQKTGVNVHNFDPYRLKEIEQKMCSIERKLAHAEIIEEDMRAEDAITIKQEFVDLFTGMKLWAVTAKGRVSKLSHHNVKK